MWDTWFSPHRPKGNRGRDKCDGSVSVERRALQAARASNLPRLQEPSETPRLVLMVLRVEGYGELALLEEPWNFHDLSKRLHLAVQVLAQLRSGRDAHPALTRAALAGCSP